MELVPLGVKNIMLYLAGQNLLEIHHIEFPDGLAVPRMDQGGVSIKLGSLR